MKCSSCNHVWFCTPAEHGSYEGDGEKGALDQVIEEDVYDEAGGFDDDDPLERYEGGEDGEMPSGPPDLDDALENILSSGYEPDEDGEQVKGFMPQWAGAYAQYLKVQSGRAAAGGYGAAILCALLIFGFVLLLSGPIAYAVPGMRNLYGVVGMDLPVPGTGLEFDKVVLKTQPIDVDKEHIYIEGNIINLTSKDLDVPKMVVELKSEEGDIVSRFLVAPPEDHLAAEAIMVFQAEYENDDKMIAFATVRFALKPDF